MFWRMLPIRLWWIGLLSAAGLVAAFYLILSHGAEMSSSRQFLGREQTIARAEASNIASFFQVFGQSTAVLAQLRSMESRNSTTVHDMDVFVDQWRNSGLVGGIILTDRNGVVQLNSNVLGTSDVGVSLADRDYFTWAKGKPKRGEYFIGQPVVSRLGATKGQIIVPVAAPVYQNKQSFSSNKQSFSSNNVFVGVISASVRLKPLTERYLGLIKVSDQTSVYVIDQRGDLLYSSSGSQPLSEKLKKTLDTTKEGRLSAEGQMIAYSPVSLSNQNWLVIVASPRREALSLTIPFYIRQVAVLLWVALSTLVFGVIVGRKGQNRFPRP